MSDSIRIRPGTPADIPVISQAYVASWRSTYQGFAPEVFVKGLTIEAASKIFADSLKPNSYSYFLHVAETPEGRIVGFADGGKERGHPERGTGELYAIYLLPEFQRRGIGKKLFNAAVQSLAQSGISSMEVWVLAQSPYRKFYEAMGGKLREGIKKLDVAGHTLQLVSYVWADLKSI